MYSVFTSPLQGESKMVTIRKGESMVTQAIVDSDEKMSAVNQLTDALNRGLFVDAVPAIIDDWKAVEGLLCEEEFSHQLLALIK